MKSPQQYIEVIEKAEDGVVMNYLTFWGKVTVDIGEGHALSINAPGHHEDPMFEKVPPSEEERMKPPYYCEIHGVKGHTANSPMCDSMKKKEGYQTGEDHE